MTTIIHISITKTYSCGTKFPTHPPPPPPSYNGPSLMSAKLPREPNVSIFFFNLIGKLATISFLTGQSWALLQFWCTVGAQNKDFVFVSHIKQKFLSFVYVLCSSVVLKRFGLVLKFALTFGIRNITHQEPLYTHIL